MDRRNAWKMERSSIFGGKKFKIEIDSSIWREVPKQDGASKSDTWHLLPTAPFHTNNWDRKEDSGQTDFS